MVKPAQVLFLNSVLLMLQMVVQCLDTDVLGIYFLLVHLLVFTEVFFYHIDIILFLYAIIKKINNFTDMINKSSIKYWLEVVDYR